MPQYYGVQRSNEYLAHYGVKGMKWGVRKAIERGSERKLDRQWRKANRKLNKLIKLGTNKDKYTRRAIGYGAGAAKLGALTLAGTSGLASGISRLGTASFKNQFRLGTALRKYGTNGILAGTSEGSKLNALGQALQKNAPKSGKKKWDAAKSIRDFGRSNSIGEKITGGPEFIARTTNQGKVVYDFNPNAKRNSAIRKITNDQILRAATGAAAAGLGIAAAKNAYRAKTADKNIIKAAQWRSQMDQAFAGTKYDKRKRKRGG